MLLAFRAWLGPSALTQNELRVTR